MEIQDFHNLHAGETCVIIGNGPGLANIPVEFLRAYKSFGSNLIYNLQGFKPTYYAAVDSRIMYEYQAKVMKAFSDIPKFLPTPNLDKWQGDNIYRFRHRPGPLWPNPLAGDLWPRGMLDEAGITYVCVTHVLLQLAYYMGFNVMLCVGLDNTTDGWHFYGHDDRQYKPDAQLWDEGYRVLKSGFEADGRQIVNLSEPTAVTSLPRDDWRNYVS